MINNGGWGGAVMQMYTPNLCTRGIALLVRMVDDMCEYNKYIMSMYKCVCVCVLVFAIFCAFFPTRSVKLHARGIAPLLCVRVSSVTERNCASDYRCNEQY